MSSFNGEDQFICPAGRPALPCPALRAGQGEIFFMSHHQGRAGQGHSRAQGRAGQKKLPCDGLCPVEKQIANRDMLVVYEIIRESTRILYH